MKLTKDGVTAAKGFWAASTAAGIKYTGRDDMALIVSSVPCKAAGVFTKNVVKAAPVVYDQNVVAKGQATAIVVNSGIARDRSRAGTGRFYRSHRNAPEHG